MFVDLLPVVRNAVQVGTESYGLKDLERVTGYVRGHDIDQGSAAVIEYEAYMADDDQAHLDRIAAYNADDVRSTLALRDWLVARRPDGLAWRAPRLEAEEVNPELDAQVEALHTYGPGDARAPPRRPARLLVARAPGPYGPATGQDSGRRPATPG